MRNCLSSAASIQKKKRYRTFAPILFVMTSLGLQYLLHSSIGHHQFLLLYPTIFFAVLLGDFIPSLIAVALCGIASAFLLAPHRLPSEFTTQVNPLVVIIFSSTGIAFCLFNRHLRNTYSRLKTSERNFRELIDLAPDAIIIINKRRKIELVSKQTLAFFGYEESELIGMQIDLLGSATSNTAVPTD